MRNRTVAKILAISVEENTIPQIPPWPFWLMAISCSRHLLVYHGVCQVQCGVTLFLLSNTTRHGSQSQLFVGGGLPTGGVAYNIARSKAAICEVGHVICRKFETGSSQNRPCPAVGEKSEVKAPKVWSVFDDSFPFTRRSDGRHTQSSGAVPISSCHVGRRRRNIGDKQGPSPESRGPGAERPVSDQIKSTQLFFGRTEKRVEQACQAVIVAREALDKALAIQQEQEAMLADGVKRLTELQENGVCRHPLPCQSPQCQGV